ncbi:hypothetical protein ACFUMH_04165 [Cellulomonas sp. NPDC057328]|uniref:hypothetical protein n=1 Tax=Cellulomonas sp. NPDC057328 TaxID=3346101 RepID=UPI00362D006D
MNDESPVLLVLTSPRSTCVWAPDDDASRRVRASLTEAGSSWSASPHHGKNVTDIEIGVDAYSSCQVLADAGFAFAWHPEQHPLNRRSSRLGVRIPGSLDNEGL